VRTDYKRIFVIESGANYATGGTHHHPWCSASVPKRRAGGCVPSVTRVCRSQATLLLLVGGLLDRLNDPAFLIAADRRVLLRALEFLDDPEASRAAECYRAAAARLSRDAAADAAYLELASRVEGNDALGDGVRRLGLPQPFTTEFARRRLTDDPLPQTGHSGGCWQWPAAWTASRCWPPPAPPMRACDCGTLDAYERQ
jgi:hypothetical protein